MDRLRDRSTDLAVLGRPHQNGSPVALPDDVVAMAADLLDRIDRRIDAFTE
jgi:hypothetical protein